jgi:hypothetical protein
LWNQEKLESVILCENFVKGCRTLRSCRLSHVIACPAGKRGRCYTQSTGKKLARTSSRSSVKKEMTPTRHCRPTSSRYSLINNNQKSCFCSNDNSVQNISLQIHSHHLTKNRSPKLSFIVSYTTSTIFASTTIVHHVWKR